MLGSCCIHYAVNNQAQMMSGERGKKEEMLKLALLHCQQVTVSK